MKRKIIEVPDKLIADSDEEVSDPIPQKMELKSNKRIKSLNSISKPELSPPDSPDKSHPSVKSKGDSLTPLQIHQRERLLDIRLRNIKAKLQKVERARKIKDKNDDSEVNALINKWRAATQKASNYLLNEAIIKINKCGGFKEFSKNENEKLKESLEYSIDSSFQERINEIVDSNEYNLLDESEKENILKDLEKQQEMAIEEMEKSIRIDDDEINDEFTMKDLYKRLKLNYKLVYPDE